jgi:hypothetical protein
MGERDASKSLTLCLASKTVRAVASPAMNESESKRAGDRGFLRNMRLTRVRVTLAAMALGGLAVVGAMGACDESTPLPSALPPADLVAPDAGPDGPADAVSDAPSSDGGNPSGDASPGDGASDAPAFVDDGSDGAPDSEAASDQTPDADVDAPDESSLSTEMEGRCRLPTRATREAATRRAHPPTGVGARAARTSAPAAAHRRSGRPPRGMSARCSLARTRTSRDRA